jgi:hypothetical protein
MSENTMWEEMTPLEEAQSMYSDYYKDVNGFRPRHTCDWTVEQYNDAMDDLQVEADIQIAENKVRDAKSIADFEALLTKTMELCSVDRTNAMRILVEAEGEDWYDWGYYCYENHLPYSYKPEGIDFKSIGVWYHLLAAYLNRKKLEYSQKNSDSKIWSIS